MKLNILGLAIALLLAFQANAQISYGLLAGANLSRSTYNQSPQKEYQTNIPSYHVSAFVEIPLANLFALQTGLSLQGKGDKYKFDGDNMDGSATWNTLSIELPINAMYYVPVNTSGAFFVGAGPYIGVNVSGNRKADGILNNWVTTGDFDLTYHGESRDMNQLDLGVNLKTGFRFKNGFLFNAVYGLGLNNLSPSEQKDYAFSNRVISLGIGFQI